MSSRGVAIGRVAVARRVRLVTLAIRAPNGDELRLDLTAPFRRMKTLQKFASVHANVHNHFNQERHLVDRQTYKQRRSAALAEWQSLMS